MAPPSSAAALSRGSLPRQNESHSLRSGASSVNAAMDRLQCPLRSHIRVISIAIASLAGPGSVPGLAEASFHAFPAITQRSYPRYYPHYGRARLTAAQERSQYFKEVPNNTRVPLVFSIDAMCRPSVSEENNLLTYCDSPCTFRNASEDNVTLNSELMSSADAVLWNPRWPGPVAESAEKPLGQKWVFTFCYEPPVVRGRNISYAETRALESKIDWTMTYSKRADFYQPVWTASVWKPLPGSKAEPTDYTQGRDGILLWFVSNCQATRFEFAEKLRAALPPGSFKIYGNCGEPSPCPGTDETDQCYQELFARFKFYASFENSRCDGYITEKFWRAIDNNMVPLVLGGFRRRDYVSHSGLPPEAFVSTDDFASMSQLVNYLTNIDAASYNNLHSWRTSYKRLDRHPFEDAWCNICKELHKAPEEQLPSGSFGPNLTEWMYTKCRDDIPSWA